MKQGQQRFGAVAIILAILVSALIGLAGWTVWNKKSTDSDNTNQETISTNTLMKTEDKTSTDFRILSDKLANTKFQEALLAVSAYCEEQSLNCNIRLLYEDGSYSKIYDTGVDREKTERGNDYYIVTNDGDGWKYNFLAGGGCKTGTDHPGLAKYCSET